ncbi:MAG: peptidyl-prolyl cis-trans isomerase, partial [Planctomycetes bacterium]|nr:peptidyl-prolyl cis-trans isomerase [Planctomycetota bacterium]
GDLADDPALARKLFAAKIGSFLGPFDTDDGKLILRITARSAGLDADGRYHGTVEGWTDDGFGVDEKISYERLVSTAYRGLTANDLENTIREWLLMIRYRGMLAEVSVTPTDTVRQDYYRQQEKVRVDHLAFRGSVFMKAVEVSEEEIEEFYNKNKDKPAPATGGPGYKQPPKVTIECIIALKPRPAEAFYTQEQLRKFYEENKDKYLRDPDAETPEHLPFEEVEERVKSDLVDDEFQKGPEANLEQAAEELDRQVQHYVAALNNEEATQDDVRAAQIQMRQTAGNLELKYQETQPISRNARDLYGRNRQDLLDLRQGGQEFIDNIFSNEYLTDDELKTAKPPEVRNRVISQIFTLRSGSKYLFRVLERIPTTVIPFDELSKDLLDTVRTDKKTQLVMELAREEAHKMAALVRVDAFNALAKELEIQPAVSEEFEAGRLPEAIEQGSALATAAGKLQAGEMSGIIDTGDSLSVVLCLAGDEYAKLIWKTLSFGLDREIKGSELGDTELADQLVNNIETYAADAPLKGNAGVRYVAAKYKDVEKTISPTDDEVKEFYEKNKAEKFADKTLEECRADIVIAIKAEKAPAKADELIRETLAKAKEDGADLTALADDNDALTSDYAYGIKLDDTTDKEFIGKAEDLARTILATKNGDIADPLKIEDGVFFFRVEYKSLGDSKEYLEEMSDEGKDKVREALLDKSSALSTVDRARMQLGRYVARAFEEAPDRHLIQINEKLGAAAKDALKLDAQLSLNNKSSLSEETINTLLKLEPNTLSDVVQDKDGRRASVFHVKSVQPLQLAKIEYVRVRPRNMLQIPSDDPEYNEKARAKALDAAQRIHAAAKDKASLKDTLKALADELEVNDPLTAVTTSYFVAGAEYVGGMAWGLGLFEKAFQLEPGELADIEDTGTDIFVARVVGRIKECREAKVKFVRVYEPSFITADIKAEQAPAEAKAAMTAFREEAVKKGSLEDALETLKKAMPKDGDKVSVESPEGYAASHVGPPNVFPTKEELLDAVFATEPGGFTPVVNVVLAHYVVHVLEFRQPGSVTVDWTGLRGNHLSDPVGLSDETLNKFYDENKEEKYRMDKQWEIAGLLAKDDAFKEQAEKDATDEALAKYFEDNKDDYQYADPEGQTVTPELDNVKDKVKRAFVADNTPKLAAAALEAARAQMAEEDADLEAIAKEHGLEHKNFGLANKEKFGRQTTFDPIKGFKDSIFEMKKGEVSETKTTKTDHWVIKITDVKESHIPELEEIETNVRRDADTAQQPERTLTAGKALREEIAKAMADGKTFEQAVAGASVSFQKSAKASHTVGQSAFARRIYSGGGRYRGGRGNQLKFVEAAFALEPGTVSAPVLEENERRTAYLLLLHERKTPEPADEDQLKQSRKMMDRIGAVELTNDTVERVENQAAFIYMK